MIRTDHYLRCQETLLYSTYMNQITFYNLNIQDHNDRYTTIGLLLLAIYNTNIRNYGKAIQTNNIANYSSYK